MGVIDTFERVGHVDLSIHIGKLFEINIGFPDTLGSREENLTGHVVVLLPRLVLQDCRQSFPLKFRCFQFPSQIGHVILVRAVQKGVEIVHPPLNIHVTLNMFFVSERNVPFRPICEIGRLSFVLNQVYDVFHFLQPFEFTDERMGVLIGLGDVDVSNYDLFLCRFFES